MICNLPRLYLTQNNLSNLELLPLLFESGLSLVVTRAGNVTLDSKVQFSVHNSQNYLFWSQKLQCHLPIFLSLISLCALLIPHLGIFGFAFFLGGGVAFNS